MVKNRYHFSIVFLIVGIVHINLVKLCVIFPKTI